MNYGSDFFLDEDGDLAFTPEGDIKVQEGSRLVAQDLSEEINTPKGTLSWSGESGSFLNQMLNNVGVTPQDITHELERIALGDPRVDASSVRIDSSSFGQYQLRFYPLGEVSSEVLLFDFQDGST